MPRWPRDRFAGPEPSSDTPANRPRLRDQVKISASSCASVAAAASRPTGPAAAAASAPKRELAVQQSWTLLRVLKTRTMSVTCRPICQPTLPPVSVTKHGGRQSPAVVADHGDAATVPHAEHEAALHQVGNDDDALGVVPATRPGISLAGMAMISLRTARESSTITVSR